MSKLVMMAICDGGACEIMARTLYSTNPREIITIEDMEGVYEYQD